MHSPLTMSRTLSLSEVSHKVQKFSEEHSKQSEEHASQVVSVKMFSLLLIVE